MGEEIAVQRRTDASNQRRQRSCQAPRTAPPMAASSKTNGYSATVRPDVGSRSSTLATPADDSASHMPTTTRPSVACATFPADFATQPSNFW